MMKKLHSAWIGLAGVLIGGVLTGGFAYLQDERAFERRSIERLEEGAVALSKASRLVSTELRGIQIEFDTLARQGGLPSSTDLKFAQSRGLTYDELDLVPTDHWDAQNDVFAVWLGRNLWVEISNFYEAMKYREIALVLTKPGQKFSAAEVELMRSESEQAGVLADTLEEIGEKSIDEFDKSLLENFG